MNSPKCLTVYLDTQDFAQLYKADISSELQAVKNQLLQYQESAKVRFPLSFLTLFEFIQDYPSDYEQDRQKRSEFMSKICGTNTFPFFMDMALKGAQIDESTWVPFGSIDKFSVSQMLSVLRHTIKENVEIPRLLKRDLQNPLVLRNFLRENLYRQKRSDNLPTNWNPDLPEFSFEFFVDYLLGDLTENEANEQFRRSVFDPAKFFSIWYKRLSNKNALQKFYGQPIDQLYRNCIEFYEKMPLAREKFNEAKRNLLALTAEFREPHPKIHLNEHFKPYETLRLPTWQETYQGSNLSARMNEFNDETRLVFEQYFSAISSIQFKPKRSDVVDAFHTVYISKSDLWRTDRSWADFLLRADIFPREKIVASLVELPRKIESLLHSSYTDGDNLQN